MRICRAQERTCRRAPISASTTPNAGRSLLLACCRRCTSDRSLLPPQCAIGRRLQQRTRPRLLRSCASPSTARRRVQLVNRSARCHHRRLLMMISCGRSVDRMRLESERFRLVDQSLQMMRVLPPDSIGVDDAWIADIVAYSFVVVQLRHDGW